MTKTSPWLHSRYQPHAKVRQAQRRLSDPMVDYVLDHGFVLHRTGVTFVVLRLKDIPPADRRNDHWARLEGSVVLLSDDDHRITVYRNKKALRDIRRKTKRRRATRERDRRAGSG